MAKAPQRPEEIFPEIISDYKGLFGDELVSIILYGSATGQDYDPAKSDVNFLIVLTELGGDDLGRVFGTIRKWRKKNVATPLFLTEKYVKTSLDVFPVEYLNFQRNHLLVYGKDILADLSFNRRFVRLQCEREIKGKLLLLREAYLQTDGKDKAMRGVIGSSLGAFIAIFEALLYLKDLDAPRGKRNVVRTVAGAFDLDLSVFEELLNIREGKTKPGSEDMKRLFRVYSREIRKLAEKVDELMVEE